MISRQQSAGRRQVVPLGWRQAVAIAAFGGLVACSPSAAKSRAHRRELGPPSSASAGSSSGSATGFQNRCATVTFASCRMGLLVPDKAAIAREAVARLAARVDTSEDL